jgi:hypothetical protein
VAREELAVAAPAEAWPVLERWGMCLIPGFEDAERCLAVGRETQEFLEQVYAAAAASGAPGGSHAGCHWQRGPGRYQSYSELAAADRPVVNIRGREADGIDLGMIDAFGLGRSDAVPVLRELVDAVEPRLAAALPGARELMATNVYYSRDLVKRRGPHVDSLKPAYKAFLYLSDARRMAVGPYCYLGGSHRHAADNEAVIADPRARGVSRPTDLPIDPARANALGGAAGDALLSNQSGIHFGAPQAPGERRLGLVFQWRLDGGRT